ncbi:MAG: hypothetical protein K2X43_18820 [Hyphomonadaceae bacterium]|jgi:hypothetical protein|nr:hypothetical protein [Hyphomonadaceae bacterium]
MKNKGMVVAACGALAMLAFTGAGHASHRQPGSAHLQQGHIESAKSRYHGKRSTRVRGFLGRRVGFYSYSDPDVINVYGGSRARFGSTNTYRDPFIDRQTTAGPFDHGFFFDSGIGPRGGDAPYAR